MAVVLPIEPSVPFSVTVRFDGDRAVVAAEGELCIGSEPEMASALEAALAAPAGILEIDLRELTFMDLSGVRLLLAAEAADRRLEVRLGAGAARRVVGLTGLEARLPLLD